MVVVNAVVVVSVAFIVEVWPPITVNAVNTPKLSSLQVNAFDEGPEGRELEISEPNRKYTANPTTITTTTSMGITGDLFFSFFTFLQVNVPETGMARIKRQQAPAATIFKSDRNGFCSSGGSQAWHGEG